MSKRPFDTLQPNLSSSDRIKDLKAKYNSINNDSQIGDKIANLRKKTIQNIKKYVSNDKLSDSINISDYITFYNIDYLIKNYIFKISDKPKIKLFELGNTDEQSYLIQSYDYIIPIANANQNFTIDSSKKVITLKIKLNLKKEQIINQLVIKLALRGDYTTLKNNKLERKKNFYKKLQYNLSVNNENDNEQQEDSEKNKLLNFYQEIFQILIKVIKIFF